jgi:acetyltransferase-like isoleucine patch superfamily enzyme
MRSPQLFRVINAVRHRWRKLVTAMVYRPQFGELGRNAVLYRPLFLSGVQRIVIGEECVIRDSARLETVERDGETPGRLQIGRGTTIEQNVHIVACGEVRIGEDVCMSSNVVILDTEHPTALSLPGNRVRRLTAGTAYVTVGDRVLIGTGATILRNVDVGEGAVIGAGAVVVRDVPRGAVVAGVPARILRMLPERDVDD